MTPRSTVRGRPLHVVTNPTVGLNLHIRRGQEKICWNASAAYLAGSVTLPAGWPGSDARWAGTTLLPGWVARFRSPAGLLGSANYLLVRSEFPTRCFFSTARVVKLIMYAKLYNIVTIKLKLTHHGTQWLKREWMIILISLILYLLKLCIFCN